MGAAFVQIAGNVGTEPKKSLDNPGRERASFRVIATERRQDATGTWVDGDQFAVTVVCLGRLAKGVADSVKLGDPVFVSGKMISRRYEMDGETHYATELKATQVGHDLSRGRATFVKNGQPRETAPAEPVEPDVDVSDVVDQLLGVG